MGYLIINGYLSNYGFSDSNILSTSFLKSGVFFLIILTLITLITFYSYQDRRPTGIIKNYGASFFINISLLSLFNALLAIILDFNELFKLWPKLIFLITTFLYFFFSKENQEGSKKNVLFSKYSILTLISLIIVVCFTNNLLIMVSIYIAGLLVRVSLGSIFDGSYKERLLIDILTILCASFAFGKYLYEKIPNSIGGGQAYQIFIKSPITIEGNEKNNLTDTLIVLYENNERLLLKNKKGEIYFTEKSEIPTYFIKTDNQINQKKPAFQRASTYKF